MDLIRRGRKEEIKEKTVLIKLSERELDRLKELAEAEGLTVSAYIRVMAIYRPHKALLG